MSYKNERKYEFSVDFLYNEGPIFKNNIRNTFDYY